MLRQKMCIMTKLDKIKNSYIIKSLGVTYIVGRIRGDRLMKLFQTLNEDK